jgi:hypothetical protein
MATITIFKELKVQGKPQKGNHQDVFNVMMYSPGTIERTEREVFFNFYTSKNGDALCTVKDCDLQCVYDAFDLFSMFHGQETRSRYDAFMNVLKSRIARYEAIRRGSGGGSGSGSGGNFPGNGGSGGHGSGGGSGSGSGGSGSGGSGGGFPGKGKRLGGGEVKGPKPDSKGGDGKGPKPDGKGPKPDGKGKDGKGPGKPGSDNKGEGKSKKLDETLDLDSLIATILSENHNLSFDQAVKQANEILGISFDDSDESSDHSDPSSEDSDDSDDDGSSPGRGFNPPPVPPPTPAPIGVQGGISDIDFERFLQKVVPDWVVDMMHQGWFTPATLTRYSQALRAAFPDLYTGMFSYPRFLLSLRTLPGVGSDTLDNVIAAYVRDNFANSVDVCVSALESHRVSMDASAQVDHVDKVFRGVKHIRVIAESVADRDKPAVIRTRNLNEIIRLQLSGGH